MLNSSICHIPETIDACPIEGRMHLRFRVQKGNVRAAFLIYCCNKNKWHEGRHRAEMSLAFTDSELEYYSVSVPLTDTRFAYIFELECSDGVTRYLSEEGLSESYDHSLGYFSFFQYCSQFDCDAMKIPQWVKTAVCYQIFPERFAQGGGDKSYVNTPWGQIPSPKSYCGGDLTGIKNRLDYLEELGVNTLYLTPVFSSPTNHKYEICDYEHVDAQFGGDEALLELCQSAHARGMRVVLDGVFNHCSSSHPFFLDALEKGRDSKYWDWFFFEEDGSYRTFASVRRMPKLNTANPALIRYFCSLAVYWMRRCGADGWRLDVSDEISHRFLRAFREAVLREREDAIIIGEDWHRAARYLNGDEYDGVMNYALTKALLDLLAFKSLDAEGFCDRLIHILHSRSEAASQKMLNLLGSHDTDRFLTRVEGDARRFRAAAALMFFYPGIPCIYYGDENGMEGGYDPDCRRCFDWNVESWDMDTHSLIRRLAGLKKQPALSEGSFEIREEEGIIVLQRKAPGQKLTLRLNPTDSPLEGLEAYGFEIREENVT